MIRKFYKILENSLKLASSRSQLIYIIILLVVPPVLFTYLFLNFQSIAQSQIETGLKQSLNNDQFTFSSLASAGLSSEHLSELLNKQVAELPLLKTVSVAYEEEGKLIVYASNDLDLVNQEIKEMSWYQSAIAHSGDTVIYPFERNGQRVWRAYRAFSIEDTQWYIHSEINLSSIDHNLAKQNSKIYLIIILVFLLMVALVWWLWRQQDYRYLQKLTAEKLQEQFNFTNMMVHELRAPLTAVNGYISMLKEEASLSAGQKKYVDMSLLSTKRLINLVNDFLEVAKIQSGTLKVEKSRYNINTVVQSVVDEMIVSANKKKLKLVSNLPPDPVMLKTDRDRLQQIITNLVSNAIKYTNSGSITVTVAQKSKFIEVRIQDTGNGISALDQAKLFKPFTRVGNADQGAEIGSGLGLWITKNLTEMLGGEINIESIEGVGTHVILHFLQKS